MYTIDASVLVETFPLAGRRVLRRPSRFPPAEMGVVASFNPSIPQILLSPSGACYGARLGFPPPRWALARDGESSVLDRLTVLP